MIKEENREENLENKFRSITEQIALIGSGLDLRIKPYENADLKYFSKLNLNHQECVLYSLTHQLQIYQTAIKDQINLRNKQQMSWSAMKKLNFIPCNDFFDKVSDTHILEIYDLNLIQVFRDIQFYGICSYSIEDLVSRPLEDLIHRDSAITNQILHWLGLFKQGKITKTIDPEIPKHRITETNSADRIQSNLKIKYYSPLFDIDKKIIGVAVIAEVSDIQYSKHIEIQTQQPPRRHLSAVIDV